MPQSRLGGAVETPQQSNEGLSGGEFGHEVCRTLGILCWWVGTTPVGPPVLALLLLAVLVEYAEQACLLTVSYCQSRGMGNLEKIFCGGGFP